MCRKGDLSYNEGSHEGKRQRWETMANERKREMHHL